MPETMLANERPDRNDLDRLMRLTDPADLDRLFRAAQAVKAGQAGNKVWFRGLVEVSNICRKNCLYCGIRSGNREARRYTMSPDTVLALARRAYADGFGSVTLQGGERTAPEFVACIGEIIRGIGAFSRGEMGITLSLGEQSEETYRFWRDLGAHRYLLRVETANPDLYRRLHPDDGLHDFGRRLECLESLKRLGYQVGTGVMIGLPGQTEEDLVEDVLFYEQLDADMIGMGPYVVHANTPLGREVLAAGLDTPEHRQSRLIRSLKMIALTRLRLRDVNIAATTALHALHPEGREKGLLAGANILMPVLTGPEYRASYALYDGKPGLNDGPDAFQDLAARVRALGETVGFGERGDSPRYRRRLSDLAGEA